MGEFRTSMTALLMSLISPAEDIKVSVAMPTAKLCHPPNWKKPLLDKKSNSKKAKKKDGKDIKT